MELSTATEISKKLKEIERLLQEEGELDHDAEFYVDITPVSIEIVFSMRTVPEDEYQQWVEEQSQYILEGGEYEE